MAFLFLQDNDVRLFLKEGSWAFDGALMVSCLRVNVCAVQDRFEVFDIGDVFLDDEDLEDGVFLAKLWVFRDNMAFLYIEVFIILEACCRGYFPCLAQKLGIYLFRAGFWSFFHFNCVPP